MTLIVILKCIISKHETLSICNNLNIPTQLLTTNEMIWLWSIQLQICATLSCFFAAFIRDNEFIYQSNCIFELSYFPERKISIYVWLLGGLKYIYSFVPMVVTSVACVTDTLPYLQWDEIYFNYRWYCWCLYLISMYFQRAESFGEEMGVR